MIASPQTATWPVYSVSFDLNSSADAETVGDVLQPLFDASPNLVLLRWQCDNAWLCPTITIWFRSTQAPPACFDDAMKLVSQGFGCTIAAGVTNFLGAAVDVATLPFSPLIEAVSAAVDAVTSGAVRNAGETAISIAKWAAIAAAVVGVIYIAATLKR
jgi:hypothetical protein